MAYTKSNELMTRIALKYDSYANWVSNNPVLLAGEVAIATIPVGDHDTMPTGFQNLPNVVMKVGDGSSHYNDLKFLSALAADVYEWAKAEQKPTYKAEEIVDLQKFVEDHSDFDSNTEYTIVAVNEYKYELKYKNIGEAEFKSFDTPVYIDLTKANERLTKLEADVKTLLGGEGETGVIAEMIEAAIGALDANIDQTASASNGMLNLHIKQEDGVVTELTGSIPANTYDAHGAAKNVQGDTTATVADVEAKHDALVKDSTSTIKQLEEGIKEAKDSVANLDYAGVEGAQAGTVISFVDKVSQTDGLLAAELGELHFNSAYDAATNKAATMADVTNAVADLNGAMHFEGVSSTDPINDKVTIDGKPDYVAAAGDIVIYETIEYVYDGSKWVQLGDETLAGTLIAALDMPRVTVGASKTLSYIEQEDGKVEAVAVDIAIAQSQVTGLEGRLEAIEAQFGDAEGSLADQVADNAAAIEVINGNDTGKSMAEVAVREANAAVAALDQDDAAVAGQYVASVKQVDGKIEVSRAALPVIPALELVEGTVAAPVEGEVTVIADIDVDGHKITDKRVNVATLAAVNAAINNLDATKDVSTAKHVMTGLVQADGLVTSIKEVALADIAFSGNIKDLKEDANTYVVFNCGSSSINI